MSDNEKTPDEKISDGADKAEKGNIFEKIDGYNEAQDGAGDKAAGKEERVSPNDGS